ncbi:MULTISPECIES: trypsin-like peptidase domain-containing protein [unclassified Rathayibacter]|uniref:trypsin-like peptidase domain-containing protein n=1 Tax=unclassified Rathayibacter TaxID=2609250 RepID=UPI001044F360|nr:MULTISPECIES: trypsin-like peptidase domain-containing protein [unclassified Rathayibacter]TCL79524.1 trypsin-like peptidase [Rathayibacter sp. PhB192]TCM25207.1 trypsin-like peptidase [Rathayibacter sp. PhB179]
MDIPLNTITTSSVPVIPEDGQGPIGTATGFVARADGVDYLVTNRHVVTGLDNITRQSLVSSRRRPTSLTWTVQGTTGRAHHHQLELYDADFEPRWNEHPQFGAAADIVAVPLGAEGVSDLHMARPVDTARMLSASDSSSPSINVTNTVFVVGYPRGHSGGLPAAAVWTQGVIASEPDLNVLGDYPTFFIDSTTHQGLSGAPVYVATDERTIWHQGVGRTSMGWPPTAIFLGIYSGRAWDG